MQINVPIAILLLRLCARSFEDWHLNFPKLTKATSLPVWWPPLLSDGACPPLVASPPWSVEDIGAVHVVKGCNQTAKPPTKEKADGFALSPQNGAVVLSQRRRWGHRTDGEKFTFASHPEERSTSQGTPSPTEKGYHKSNYDEEPGRRYAKSQRMVFLRSPVRVRAQSYWEELDDNP